MQPKELLKSFLRSQVQLYKFYARIRYGKIARIRDKIESFSAFKEINRLGTIVFENDKVFFRTQSQEEFRYIPSLMGGLLGLEYNEQFEMADINYLINTLPSDAVVLDIGANFGFYSIRIANKCSQSKVHAFEPVADTARILRENIARNGLSSQITVNNLALGDHCGSSLITADRYAGNHLTMHQNYSGKTQLTELTTVDQYVLSKGLAKLNLIKCDVEGAELMVMSGATSVLKTMRPIVMLEIASEWTTRFSYKPSDLFDFMDQCGYTRRSPISLNSEAWPNSCRQDTNNFYFFPNYHDI